MLKRSFYFALLEKLSSNSFAERIFLSVALLACGTM